MGGNNKVNCCTSCVPVGLLTDMSYFKLTNNRPTYTYICKCLKWQRNEIGTLYWFHCAHFWKGKNTNLQKAVLVTFMSKRRWKMFYKKISEWAQYCTVNTKFYDVKNVNLPLYKMFKIRNYNFQIEYVSTWHWKYLVIMLEDLHCPKNNLNLHI